RGSTAMKLRICVLSILGLTVLAAPEGFGATLGGVLGREGSELGNSFVPFDSKIGEYKLEYSKKWRFTDLSQTASFTDSEPASSASVSFLSVHTDRTGGPATVNELRERIEKARPSVHWEPFSLAGLSGFRG